MKCIDKVTIEFTDADCDVASSTGVMVIERCPARESYPDFYERVLRLIFRLEGLMLEYKR